MLFVLVVSLYASSCVFPPCAVEVNGRKYRDLVYDSNRRFQSYGALPLNSEYVSMDENQPYWIEKADAWMSHDLTPTIGNRSIEFYTDRAATMSVLTRGIPPYIMLDEDFLGTEEFIRYRVDRGSHRVVWITEQYVNPRKGNGFMESVQTAIWLNFVEEVEDHRMGMVM